MNVWAEHVFMWLDLSVFFLFVRCCICIWYIKFKMDCICDVYRGISWLTVHIQVWVPCRCGWIHKGSNKLILASVAFPWNGNYFLSALDKHTHNTNNNQTLPPASQQGHWTRNFTSWRVKSTKPSMWHCKVTEIHLGSDPNCRRKLHVDVHPDVKKPERLSGVSTNRREYQGSVALRVSHDPSNPPGESDWTLRQVRFRRHRHKLLVWSVFCVSLW